MTNEPHEHREGADGEQEPREDVRFTDKRRIDPETGQRRDLGGENAPETGAETPEDGGDAVSQAEQILNEAAENYAEQDGEQDGAGQGADAAVVDELRGDLQRLQAEFVNYRRRVDRDRSVAKETAINSMIESLLPVLDDIDAARTAGDLEDGPFAAIAKKLDQVLTSHGLQRQDQEALVGVEFNPAQHEAMLRQPSDEVPEEHIIQVFRNGYVRGERVLRAAQVMVSAGQN
ncbi:MAG: nucleotide exchange factor GrpE [Micrococcaceae bacterium]